ncbi:MAG: metal ABC transporter ATP-binding protein [Chlamydiales bacterium]
MRKKILEIDNLSFGYEKTPILQGVDLAIHEGEFIVIFGPNGGGKTTFLKLLMGFLEPVSGTISLFGKTPRKARQKLSYVPQVAQFDRQFPLSVLELVLMGRLNQTKWWGGFPREAKKEALDALEKVGLLEKAPAPFGTLSGGQAQRALIARALVSNPELLLLDEPTASVDPEAEKQIHALLLKLKGSMTILMVTHDLQPLLEKADRLLCVHRTVGSYTPKQVCEHFAVGLYHPTKS